MDLIIQRCINSTAEISLHWPLLIQSNVFKVNFAFQNTSDCTFNEHTSKQHGFKSLLLHFGEIRKLKKTLEYAYHKMTKS